MPQPVPQKRFWSVTVYDSVTRSQIQTDQDKAALRSLIELKDLATTGTTEISFGPSAPTGKEKQWIKTIPGKGWFAWSALRTRRPGLRWSLEKPGDFEVVQGSHGPLRQNTPHANVMAAIVDQELEAMPPTLPPRHA